MRRKAFTLTEALIALALLALIFSLLYGFVHTARQQEERAARTLTAVAHAQRAADTLSSDLRSIVPPTPTGGQHVMKIEDEGRTITFLRTEMKNGQMIASPVTYRASPTRAGHGNLELTRNGRTLGVLLSDFFVQLEPTPRNPRIRVRLTGVATDLPAERRGPGETHAMDLALPFPAVSPAAMIDLPADARAVMDEALKVRGGVN